jgi:hypothetical protein
MTIYNPDNWVIVKIQHKGSHYYKVLGGWSGGYLNGSSWRMNSGITEIHETDDNYYFKGSTGSEYRCAKSENCVRMNIAHVLAQLDELHGDKIEVLPEGTDYMNINWNLPEVAT